MIVTARSRFVCDHSFLSFASHKSACILLGTTRSYLLVTGRSCLACHSFFKSFIIFAGCLKSMFYQDKVVFLVGIQNTVRFWWAKLRSCFSSYHFAMLC